MYTNLVLWCSTHLGYLKFFFPLFKLFFCWKLRHKYISLGLHRIRIINIIVFRFPILSHWKVFRGNSTCHLLGWQRLLLEYLLRHLPVVVKGDVTLFINISIVVCLFFPIMCLLKIRVWSMFSNILRSLLSLPNILLNPSLSMFLRVLLLPLKFPFPLAFLQLCVD